MSDLFPFSLDIFISAYFSHGQVTGQVEEVSSNMASLRVKVDRLMDRVGSLAERIETAHEPSIDSLRVEISQARGQERRELDAEIQSLKSRLQHTQDLGSELRT